MNNRVLVTGMGAVSPLGHTVADAWSNVAAGKSGIGPITLYDDSNHKSHALGEVHEWDPDGRFGRRDARRMDRYMQFALAAAEEALAQANLVLNDTQRDRAAVIVGTAVGGILSLLEEFEQFRVKGPGRVGPFLISKMLPDSAAGHIALTFGLRGPNLSLNSACATGTNAIGEAFRLLQTGHADIALAGAAEAALSPLILAGFENMGALSTRDVPPSQASAPFSADRDGFVAAEGAAAVVLETETHARNRGATILGEVLGYALNNDAYHMTAPAPDGAGAVQCMRLALADASLLPEDIDYINAHGTSTPLNDKSETAAIKTVFGDYAHRVPVSSTKSMHGHLLGAAGALEAILSLKAIAHQTIPPTINLQNPDPACDLDYVPHVARGAALRRVMSNSFGFGGHNACLVLGAYHEDGSAPRR